MMETLREQLIYTMFESLYREGYNACNLADLLKKAGTSKGGMYHHFSSKKELALESIRSVSERFIDLFWDQYFDHYDDPIVALKEILAALPNATIIGDCPFEFQYGCPLNHMIQEMGALDEDFKILLESILERWIALIAKHLKKAQMNGRMTPAFESDVMAQFIVSSVEGILTVMKIKQDIRIYTKNTEQLITMLQMYRS